MAEHLAALTDDPDVQPVDQGHHALALVRVADPDVVQPGPVAEGDLPVLMIRSLRTRTPASIWNRGPEGRALSRAYGRECRKSIPRASSSVCRAEGIWRGIATARRIGEIRESSGELPGRTLLWLRPEIEVWARTRRTGSP